MNSNFPFRSNFNRERFQEEIYRANKKKPERDDPEHSYLTSHGIKYVAEAPGYDANYIRMVVRDSWLLDTTVEPLFQRSENRPEVPKALQAFFLISIPGVAFSDLTVNPYDAAYALLAGSQCRSVEPDLPYTHFISAPVAASGGGGGSGPQSDKAWSLRNIRADKAWLIPATAPGQQDGRGVTIAHLDTGWTNHRDLDQTNFDLSRAKDFIDPNGDARDPMDYHFLANPGHGTKTGSVIMSRGDVSSTGTVPPDEITGVARFATYVPIRCIKRVVIIFNSNVAQAVEHATAYNCDVISMSLGGRPMKALHTAIQIAKMHNMLIVCAAGNRVHFTVWPANYKESIAVAASNYADQPWAGSSRGHAVEISAPGEDVWIAVPDATGVKVDTGSGTSYATANVAGVAALWLAFFGKRKLLFDAQSKGQELQDLFRDEIQRTARTPQGWDTNLYGKGIVDALNLIGSSGTPITTGTAPSPSGAHDYVAAGMATAQQLLQQRGYAPTDAFNNELAGIFLDEANENAGSEFDIATEYFLDVIRRRGSETIKAAMRLNGKM